MQKTNIESYEINEVLRALEESLFNYWRSIMLRDHKEFIEELFKGTPCDSFERIMHFFTNNFKGKDLENRFVAKMLYKKLGWSSSNYDVINSFWTTFACLIVITGSRYHAAYDFISNFPKLPYPKNSKDENKKTYPKQYLARKNNPNQDFIKIINESRDTQFIDELALLCHSAANFMPCPNPPFNQAKGTTKAKFCLNGKDHSVNLTNDYLPLMIELIEKVYFDEEEKEPKALIDFSWKGGKEDKYEKIEKAEVFYSYSYYDEKSKKWCPKDKCITKAMIEEWENWFLNEENCKNYFLEDYYVIHEENGNRKLKGKPLFKNQSLSYPIPKTKEEIDECIKNIIFITNRRADSMAKRIISKMKNGETCKDIWS